MIREQKAQEWEHIFKDTMHRSQNQMLVWERMTVPSWNCWCSLSNIHNQKGQGAFSHLKKWHRNSWRWESIQNQVWISSFLATQNSSNFRCELCCLITLFQHIHSGYSLHQQRDEDQFCLLPSIIPGEMLDEILISFWKWNAHYLLNNSPLEYHVKQELTPWLGKKEFVQRTSWTEQ